MPQAHRGELTFAAGAAVDYLRTAGTRDSADIRFLRFADAAFVRVRGADFVTMQRMSPKQSLNVAIPAGTETTHSLPLDPTTWTRKKRIFLPRV
jgi:hypothetical protein